MNLRMNNSFVERERADLAEKEDHAAKPLRRSLGRSALRNWPMSEPQWNVSLQRFLALIADSAPSSRYPAARQMGVHAAAKPRTSTQIRYSQINEYDEGG